MGSEQPPNQSDDATSSTSKTLWGGRFQEPTDAFVERFTASVQFDQRLYSQDIQGSIAHATMLTSVGVLTSEEAEQIIEGLNAIASEIESGNFNWS
ncbi:MAG: lyase family protein, partial [Pseudomonadales bacterium]|nr:lyase family protein [Pseudomonadales bacterium]